MRYALCEFKRSDPTGAFAMKYTKHLILIIVLFFAYNMIFPRSAYAYLDPGSMTYILQIFIAVLIGGLFAIKIFWTKIKLFCTKLFSRKKQSFESDVI